MAKGFYRSWRASAAERAGVGSLDERAYICMYIYVYTCISIYTQRSHRYYFKILNVYVMFSVLFYRADALHEARGDEHLLADSLFLCSLCLCVLYCLCVFSCFIFLQTACEGQRDRVGTCLGAPGQGPPHYKLTYT